MVSRLWWLLGQLVIGCCAVASVDSAVVAQGGEAAASIAGRDAVDTTHREPVDASAYPWSAIGALFNSSRTGCTAVAVAQDQVVSAAHCLYSRQTRRMLPPESLHILLGFVRGSYGLDAAVRSYRVGARYDPGRPSENPAADWAVLTLKAPLPAERRPLPLATRVPEVGARAVAAGYGQDRMFMMTADRDCRVLGMNRDNLLLDDCHLLHGYSGGPLLALANGTDRMEVVGVNVAIGLSAGAKVSAAVPAASIRRELEASPSPAAGGAAGE